MTFLYNIVFKGDNADLKKKAGESENALGKLKETAISVGETLGLAYGTYFSGEQLIEVTKKYQSLRAQLQTSTGSIQNASKAFAALKDFAKQTGQETEDVVTAFNRLVNLGLDPSKESLTAYGNIAAASGKTTIDFVEAVADAATGEYERLKEFGIKSSAVGNKVTFTFRGMNTTISNDAKSIEAYLKSLGQVQYAGALQNQASTLEGSINKMKISWDDFVYAISTAGAGNVITEGVNLVTNALTELGNMLASGQLQAQVTAWGAQFNDVFKTLKKGADDAFKLLKADLGSSGKDINDWKGFLLKALNEFPANITAMVKILTVEMASWVDIGRAYGTAFAQVIGVELAKLVEKLKIFGQQAAHFLEFWKSDDFDAASAYQAADDIANGMANAYLQAADDQIAASKAARLSSIEDALAVRDQTVAAYGQATKAAQGLRNAYDAKKKQDESTDLGQFKTKDGNGQQQPAGTQITQAQINQLKSGLQTEREQLTDHYAQLAIINENGYAQGKIQHEDYLRYKQRIIQQYEQKSAQMEAAAVTAQLGNYEQLFSGLSSVASTFGGEQSKTYKVLFATSKAFSIAQAIIAIQTGISKAIALGFPAAIPVIATTVAEGATVLNNIKSTNLQGQAHDGINYVPASNEGTWLLKKGEMVLNSTQRDNFENLVDKVNSGNSTGSTGIHLNNTISIDARGASDTSAASISTAMDAATLRMKQEIAKDFANGGPLYRQLKNRGLAA